MHRVVALRRLCGVCSLVYLLYACLLAGLSHSGLSAATKTQNWWPWLGDKPIGEDGFYMLTVADRLATTHHLTYNCGSAASGIQPLATFLYAAIAAALHLRIHATDAFHFALLRAVLITGTVLSMAFAWMLADIAASLVTMERRALVFTFAYLITMLNFTSFRLFTYGLETGIYLCILAICLQIWLRVHATRNTVAEHWRNLALLGVAGGAAGLARIDFGLLFAILLLWLLLRRTATFAQTLVTGAIAAAIVAPWFLFVHRATGGWMPTSGLAEGGRDWQMRAHLGPWAWALVAHLVPWSYAGSGNRVLVVAGILSILILTWLAVRQNGTGLWTSSRLRDTLLPWAIAVFVLSVVYGGFFLSTFFYTRYFAPLLLVTIPLIALLLAATPLLQRHPSLVALPLLAMFAVLDVVTLQSGNIGNPHFPAVAYVRKVMPNAHIGAFQSGVLGYFDPNVENLDGKLNQAALVATRSGHLDAFLDSEGIDVLLDWPSYLQINLPAPYLAAFWERCPIAPPNPQDVCFVRKTYLVGHPELR